MAIYDSDPDDGITRLETPDSLAKHDHELLEVLWKCCDATDGVNLRVAFNGIDTSGDGSVDEKEFSYFLFKQGVEPTRSEFIKLMRTFDANGDGSISYREFSKVMTVFRDSKKKGKGSKWHQRVQAKKRQQFRKKHERHLQDIQLDLDAAALLDAKKKGATNLRIDAEMAERMAKVEKLWGKMRSFMQDTSTEMGVKMGLKLLRNVFRDFDKNGDARLSSKELSDGLEAAGIHISKRNMGSLMSQLDTDMNGTISFGEFRSGMERIVTAPTTKSGAATPPPSSSVSDGDGGDSEEHENPESPSPPPPPPLRSPPSAPPQPPPPRREPTRCRTPGCTSSPEDVQSNGVCRTCNKRDRLKKLGYADSAIAQMLGHPGAAAPAGVGAAKSSTLPPSARRPPPSAMAYPGPRAPAAARPYSSNSSYPSKAAPYSTNSSYPPKATSYSSRTPYQTQPSSVPSASSSYGQSAHPPRRGGATKSRFSINDLQNF